MPGETDHPLESAPAGRQSSGRNWIESATSALARDVGRSGTEHWAAFEIDSEKGREVACLRRWANESGAWLDSAKMIHWHGGLGLGEHDVKELGGRIWKATKDNRFGIYFAATGRATGDPVRQIQKLSTATPHQYLTRLALLNDWCRTLPGAAAVPEMTRMEGIAVLDGRFAIITSQCLYPHDEAQPSSTDLATWLMGFGFKSVTAGIFYRPADNLALFDVKPANIIRSAGVLRPVDVIPITPTGLLAAVLREIAG